MVYRAPAVGNHSPQRAVAAVWRQPLVEDMFGKGVGRGPPSGPGISQVIPSTAAQPSATSAPMEGAPPMRRQPGQLQLPTHQRPGVVQGVPAVMVQAAGVEASDAGEDVDGYTDRPWSLCSTTQTLQPNSIRHDGSGNRGVDLLTARVDEALVRLTLIVDTAMAEMRAELPRARERIERQQAELQRLSLEQTRNNEEQSRGTANCCARIEAFAHNLANETVLRVEAEQAQKQAVELLERNLAQETEARCGLENALGKDLREHVALEVEGVREMAMREMRERMDGQKVIREEAQLQQQALMGLTTRIDDALIELRTELPSLKQDSAAQKAELEKISSAQLSSAARLELVEKSIAEESRRLRDAEQALSADLRETLEGQVREFQKSFDAQLRLLQDSSRDQADMFARKLGEAEAATRDLTDIKIRECEASMQTWVETSAGTRLTELDRVLKKEMTDRSRDIKEVLDKTSHNADRWAQLQAKFDELLIEVM